jgi:hypothetical protein
VTSVRTVAGLGAGAAVLSMLAGCSSGTTDGTVGVSAPMSATDSAASSAAPKRTTPAPAETLFSGPSPVSIVSWWKDNPAAAPKDLAKRKLLFNQRGEGPRRFAGPDVRKYNRLLMVITCVGEAEYLVRLQVLDGISIASTSGATCGGPALSAYNTPLLRVEDRKTEVEVQVPAGTKYYVTIYGRPA